MDHPMPCVVLVFLLVFFSTMVGGNMEKEQDYYFPSLQRITSDISNQIDADSFVSLKPNKPFTGGFGNVLWHYLEVQGLAMATKRHAIINNAAINALFSHPNLKNSATSTTSYWKLKSLNEVLQYYDGRKSGLKTAGQLKTKTELFPCGKVSTFPITSFSKDYYVHGCLGNNLMHPNIKPVLATLMGLQKTLPALGKDNHDLFVDVLFSFLFHWMYSNPKPLFKSAAEKKITQIQAKCTQKKSEKTVNPKSNDVSSSTSNVIDLTIQVRTFIDTEGNNDFNKSRKMDTFRHCALRATVSAQNRKRTTPAVTTHEANNQTQHHHHHRILTSTTPLCVYVTSDSPQAADDMRAHLEADPNFTGTDNRHSYITQSHPKPVDSFTSILRHLAILSLRHNEIKTISIPNPPNFYTHQTGVVVSYTELGNHDDWHSMPVLMKGSKDTAINEFEISTRSEFLDWYILSTSIASMYTYESTFATSARRRAGYFGARHDFWVKPVGGPGNKMVCEAARQMSVYCDVCTDKLTNPPGSTAKHLCPVEIQTECAAGIVTIPSTTVASTLSTTSNTSPTFSSSSVPISHSKEALSPSSAPTVSSISSNSKVLEEYENIIADLKTRIAILEAKEKERDKDKDKTA